MGPTTLTLLSPSNQQVDGLQISLGTVLGRGWFQAQLECPAVCYRMLTWEVSGAVSGELVKVGLHIESLPPGSHRSAAAKQSNLVFHEFLLCQRCLQLIQLYRGCLLFGSCESEALDLSLGCC